MIEYARNVIGMTDANSTEFDSSTPYPVVISMPEMNGKDLGGTMRCGLRRSVIYRTYEIADACMAADAVLWPRKCMVFCLANHLMMMLLGNAPVPYNPIIRLMLVLHWSLTCTTSAMTSSTYPNDIGIDMKLIQFMSRNYGRMACILQ